MLYVVKKPIKVGSNLVAKILGRVLKVSKIGFAGTLDPLATGLMIIGTNGSPRLFPLIEHFSKTYVTTIRLDGTTDSYDLEQPIRECTIDPTRISELSKEYIQDIIDKNFVWSIAQTPPNFSATWVNWKRAYDLARKGEEIELKSKQRVVHNFEILEYAWPKIVAKITVSHGTYIRSLARDMGIALGTGWYLEQLERTSLWHINLGWKYDWQIHNDIVYARISHEELFPDIPVIELNDTEKKHIRLGSTPLATEHKNGRYFVQYDDSYGLLEAKEWLLYPLKNVI